MVCKAFPHSHLAMQTIADRQPRPPSMESPLQVIRSLSEVRFPMLLFNKGVQPSKQN